MHLLVLHIYPRFINAVFEMFGFHLFPENPVFRLLSLFKDAKRLNSYMYKTSSYNDRFLQLNN